METNKQTNVQLNNYVPLLSSNVNGAQRVNIKAIYNKSCSCIWCQSTKTQHNNNTNRKKCGEFANKLFSWALVRQMATCHFHACVYRRRSFYRIFNALPWHRNWMRTHGQPRFSGLWYIIYDVTSCVTLLYEMLLRTELYGGLWPCIALCTHTDILCWLSFGCIHGLQTGSLVSKKVCTTIL